MSESANPGHWPYGPSEGSHRPEGRPPAEGYGHAPGPVNGGGHAAQARGPGPYGNPNPGYGPGPGPAPGHGHNPGANPHPYFHPPVPPNAAGYPVYGPPPAYWAGGTPPREPKTRKQVLRETSNLGNLVHSFKRRWFLAMFLGLLAASGGAFYAWWSLAPPRYASNAVVKIRPPAPNSAFENRSVSVASMTEFMDAQKILLKSDPVLRAAVDSPGILDLPSLEGASDPVAWLDQHTHALNANDTMLIAAEAAYPDDARKLVNALIEAFVRSAENAEMERRLERQKQLKDTLEGYQTELEGRRSQINALYDSVGARDRAAIAFKSQNDLKRLDEMEEKLFEVQSQIRQANLDLKASDIRLKAAAAMTQAATKADIANYNRLFAEAVEDVLAKDRQAEVFRTRIALIKSSFEDARKVVRQGDLDPFLRKRKEDLANHEKAYENYQRTIRKRVADDLRAKIAASQPNTPTAVAEARTAIEETRQRLVKLKEEEGFRIEQRDKLQQEFDAMQISIRQLEILLENARAIEESEAKVREQFEATRREMGDPLRIELTSRGGPARLIDDHGRKWVLTVAIGLAAMSSMVLLVVLLEARAKRIYSTESVSETLGFNIVGMVPKLPRAAERGTGRGRKHELFASILRDSIDEIRTQVLHRCQPGLGQPRMILMTSAMPREGKSTLCISLAESLARSGHRVLLVDCDLRRPILHLTLEMPIAPGISEVLTQRASLESVIRPSGILPSLWVVTAGGHRPEGILALNRLTDVRAQAERHFDFILIDSAPVLPVPDTLVVSKCADYALFVVMRNSSRMTAVYDAYQRLCGFGIPVLGTIVNGVQLDRGYGYGYGYASTSTAADHER